MSIQIRYRVILEKLCRVCGKLMATKSGHLCSNHLDDLLNVFGVSAESDNPNMHEHVVAWLRRWHVGFGLWRTKSREYPCVLQLARGTSDPVD